MTFDDLILIECTCNPNEHYPDGTKPKFFTDKDKALKEFIRCKKSRQTLYWGVHYNKLHLTGVID